MKRSSKQESVSNISFTFGGGVNLALPPQDIADNELTLGMNWMYDADTDIIEVRPGTTCVTPTVSSFPDPIRSLHYYEKSVTQAWLCGASGSTLCNLTATGWQTIGTIQSTQTCRMETYNNKLIIADGSTNLRSWDGTTVANLTALKATCLAVIGGRLAVNHLDEPDSVYLCSPYDETGWDTTKTAVGLRVGFGDMLAVNGFGVYGTNLIVSKLGSSEKRLYRVDMTDASPTNWTISLLSAVNATQNPQCMINAYSNIFFCDNNGFKSVLGVMKYGDLDVDDMGTKINTHVRSHTCYCVKYIPIYNAVFILLDSQAYVMNMRQGTPRFTDLLFGQGIIESIVQAGNTVYLGGKNGVLYAFDESASTDEISTGVFVQYSSTLRSKLYVYAVDLVLRKFQTFFIPILAATGKVSIVDPYGIETTVAQFTTPSASYLYNATGDLNSETEFLADMTSMPSPLLSRNRTRKTGMSLQVGVDAGRCGIDKVQAEIAVLQGGE